MSLGGLIFTQACNAFQNSLLRNLKLAPRVAVQVQSVREIRRSCYRRPWHTVRTLSPYWKKKELTAENEEFLQQTVLDRYKEKVGESPLKDGPWERNEWTTRTSRCGVLAVKIGVIPQWTKAGEKFYTTLLQVLDNHVIRYIPPEEYAKYNTPNNQKKSPRHGSIVVGALSTDPFKFTKAYCGLFAEAGVPPKRKLTRFFVTPDAAIQPGTPLYANHFQVGSYVDVQAKTIGHGFQGVVKRWGFKGGPASHGTTKWHRRPGNIGGGRGKSKVFKGKKMPGHMGMAWSTLKGLKIWRIDTKYNILYVHGQAVPGPTHCYVRIFDTSLFYRREAMLQTPPIMPTFFPGDEGENQDEELFDEELFQFNQPSIIIADTEKAKKSK